MEEENRNILGFALFFFCIALLVLGGSVLIFLNYKEQKKTITTNSQNETIVTDKKKVDKNKDFIYYTDEEVISESLSLTSKIPVINLDSEDAKNVSNEVKEYAKSIKNTLKKNTENKTCTYENQEGILETSYLDYGVYEYQEYSTLFIRESKYSCEEGFSSSYNVKAYTFDKTTGKRITKEELLAKYDTTLTQVLERIRKNLEESQTIVDDVETIKIEETIGNLKENSTFAIYMDEFGDLVMNYVVKTNSVDYNDSITINE